MTGVLAMARPLESRRVLAAVAASYAALVILVPLFNLAVPA